MKLIVGLGNPGVRHEYNRHNFGWLSLTYRLHFKYNGANNKLIKIVEDNEKYKYYMYNDNELYLYSLTYMNDTGIAVKEVVDTFKIDKKDILVVCDDLNLDFGSLKLRANGSDGRHKGLGSIIEHLNTDEFARLRCGIGKALTDDQTIYDYVLSNFNIIEMMKMKNILHSINDAIDYWLSYNIEKAISYITNNIQNKIHIDKNGYEEYV